MHLATACERAFCSYPTLAILVSFWLQVQQEMNLVKSQPLKSSLEVIGAQVKLEAASISPATTAPALPGCSVRSLLQDMGLQVHLFLPCL